jgi:tRNA (cmo5U34)-methyltransferase
MPAEARRMLIELASDFAISGSALYELGVGSSGLLPSLHTEIQPSVQFVGTDASEEHLRRVRQRLLSTQRERSIDLQRVELNRGISLRDASVVILVATSNALSPSSRASLLSDVHRGLRSGGCALMLESTRGRDSLLNNLFASHVREHSHLVRNPGEDIQRASSLDEERDLLMRSGFRSVEIFYKWYDLCGLVAVK